MTITILGSGTSGGVPMIGCPCEVCRSSDPRDKRLRSSVLIEVNGRRFIIDTGPDFRQQMLRENVTALDGVVFTHSHRDHTAGLDDVRAFNYFQQKPMDVYASTEVQENLKKEFYYAFADKWYPGLPQINFHTIDGNPFYTEEVKWIPVRVLHYKMEVYGYRINDFTYITDANFISPEEIEKIRGSKVVILNALRREPHISHYDLDEALKVAATIGAPITYLTHLSHQMGLHTDVESELPKGVKIAYDGLHIEL